MGSLSTLGKHAAYYGRMRPIDRSIARAEPIAGPLGGMSARGVKLTCATFVLAVAGGYLWLVWLHSVLRDLLG